MNALNKGQREVKKSLDTEWHENLEKLEGPLGTQILVNDNPDLISRLIKTVKDKDKLPYDMGNPETMTQVEAVNEYANNLYDLFCEGSGIAEEMMVGAEVKKRYENIELENFNTQDMYQETGHTRADF